MRLPIAAVLVLLAATLSACTDECVDAFDCRAFSLQDNGRRYTCQSNRCTPCPDGVCPGEGMPESDGGLDGGETEGDGGEVDAGGLDAGDTDAGQTDAGTTDAGQTDAGTTDAGQTDSGTTDAGSSDAGTVDYSGTFEARLNGAQPIPPSSSTETGTATVTLTKRPGDYGLAISGSHGVDVIGLTAHLHTGVGGATGADEVTLVVTSRVVAVPGTLSTVIGGSAVSTAVAREIAQGRAYLDIHSVAVSTGEIRGQVLPRGAGLATTTLSGAAEVPANPHPGTGAAQLVVRVDAGVCAYEARWSSDVVAQMAHVHQGGAGVNGGVLETLALLPDAGGASGSFLLGASSFVTGDTDGGLYVNVHTADAGAGLVRGQLKLVLLPN